jgi:hypothetical protein
MVIESLLQQLGKATIERLHWIISLEECPYTLNEHYFSTTRERYLTLFRDGRTPKADVQNASVDAQQAALSALALIGYNVQAQDLKKLLPSDEYEEELIVMSEVRAYWQVSYKVIYPDDIYPFGLF